MKSAVRKGKAAGGLSYGYRVAQQYDAKGDRIPGLREINPEQAAIIQDDIPGICPRAISDPDRAGTQQKRRTRSP